MSVMTNAPATFCVFLCILIQSVYAQAQQASSEVAQRPGESEGLVKPLLSDAEREAESNLRKLGVRIGRDDSGEVYSAEVSGPKCDDDVVAHLEELSWSNKASSRAVGRWATWIYPNLVLENTSITDDGFARLPSLTRFRYMRISDNVAITDSALKHLKHCPQLRGLRISGTGFTGDGIVHLKELKNLGSFSMLNTTGMTDDGVESLKELTNLESLELGGKEINDARIKHVASMENLTSLSLQDTQTTDAGMGHLASMRNLTELSVEDHFLSDNETPVKDEGLKYFSSLTNLNTLHLRRLEISDVGLKYLRSLNGLERLRLRDNKITDAGLVNLSDMVQLRQLELSENEVGDSGLAHLTRLTKLEQLYIDNTEVTDDGLVHLTGLASLQELHLQDTDVTERGMDMLRRHVPECDIRSGSLRQTYVLGLFDGLDINSDGKVTADEMPPRRRALLLSVDANGDGVLAKEELDNQHN